MSICRQCQSPTEGRAYTLCIECVKKISAELHLLLEQSKKDKLAKLRSKGVDSVDITINGDIVDIDEEKELVYVNTPQGLLTASIWDVTPIILAPG